MHDDFRKIPSVLVKCFLANLKPFDSEIGDFECASDTFKRDIKSQYEWNQAAKNLFQDWIANFPALKAKVNIFRAKTDFLAYPKLSPLAFR